MTGSGTPTGSVIIPAWNEQSVIGRTLDSLLEGSEHHELDITIACNGCTDDTVTIARGYGHRVRVLDLPAVGKSRAIREAEAHTSILPRMYLDADVELTGAAAVRVLESIGHDCLAARPPIDYDVTAASWPVRRYYAVRADLPAVANDLCGAGVYAIGESARSRFGEFPDVLGDDLFVARVVARHETRIVDCDPVRVCVPRDLRSLVSILRRAHRGNVMLTEQMPELVASKVGSTVAELIWLARSPRRWIDVSIYAFVAIASRWRAGSNDVEWERDETSRMVGSADDDVDP